MVDTCLLCEMLKELDFTLKGICFILIRCCTEVMRTSPSKLINITQRDICVCDSVLTDCSHLSRALKKHLSVEHYILYQVLPPFSVFAE